MRVQNEFLDAVNHLDLAKATSLSFKLAQMSGRVDATTQFDTSLSLDKFQSKYTSEDNESFQTIIEKHNAAKRERYSWMYDQEKKMLLLKPSQDPVPGNAILDSVPPAMLEPAERVSQTTGTWAYKAKNALMYGPEGAPLTLADLKQSRGAPKEISHAATRFAVPEGHVTTSQVMNLSAEKSVHQQRMHTEEVWKQVAKATPALFRGDQDGSETNSPKVAGFGFVEATPTLVPGKDVDASELITWGMIEGTPLLIDSGSAGGSGMAFRMPPTPRREEVGMRLSDRAAKALKKRIGGSQTPTAPRGPATPGAAGSRMWSPAAQTLLANAKRRSSVLASSARTAASGSAGIGGIGGIDMQLRASYSQSPLAPSPRPASSQRASFSSSSITPLAAGSRRLSGSITPSLQIKKPKLSSLTDNLL
eukprot:jgi/Hompol1/6969/HPOL_000872-RA